MEKKVKTWVHLFVAGAQGTTEVGNIHPSNYE